MFDTKYRVDFIYWYKDKGFAHIETGDHIEYPIEAKAYANEIDEIAKFMGLKEQGYGMPKTDADAILVRVIDNENDYPLSDYWWENRDKEGCEC